jgi:hypothetical protein
VITANNCPTAEAGVFTLSSTGTSGVTFFVDGKRGATVDNAPFRTKIKAFKLSRGHHKLTAKVTFTGGERSAPVPGQVPGRIPPLRSAQAAELHGLSGRPRDAAKHGGGDRTVRLAPVG